MGHDILQQLIDDMRQIEDIVDSIEIPARGRCKVYMAKYGYDPFKQSPNDNPDAELAFNAGDYIMVFDDIDEDGYFIGELMDGRRGYVPSNWLDRLTGEDLFEFQATTLYNNNNNNNNSSSSASNSNNPNSSANKLTASSKATGGQGEISMNENESDCNSIYPPEFYDSLVQDTMNHSNFQHLMIAPEDYQRMNDYVDLDDVDEVDDECLSDYERAEAEQSRRAVPPPQRLILERQLNKSILIGWLHPQAAKGTIVSYQVYVDGVLKSTVPSGDRTKALLEGVDSYIPHRISVRAIDLNGRHSNDAGCTIVIGQKIPFAPSCVKASHITSDSALISWLPCNSNFHHTVAVNSVEIQTVRPGVYKHLINGLSANTLYRVWVRAKPGKILSIDEKNPKKLESLTTYVDFKTMPKSLPDPPVNVQVEAGPQRRTLLVTWLPLTLNDYGNSNNCPVTGYAVFAGHKKLADIDSPTSDHALLDLTDLESLHKKSVTVRTKSGENLSQDSMPCQIPDEYLKSSIKSIDNLSNNLQAQQQQPTIRHGYLHHQSTSSNHHHRLPADHHGHRSPSKSYQQRYNNNSNSNNNSASSSMNNNHSTRPARYNSNVRGRQMARSMQNLESDLESRRSSIPAIEITRETSAGGSDIIHQNPNLESFSEEEFENSMRFRGIRSKTGRLNNQKYRARQSQSVDSAHNNNSRYQSGSLAKLRGGGGGGGTPLNQQQASDIRYFVALFDYDPSTMSPNPNAASEELAFKEGSIIKIHGDKGPDGFYRGELDNHFGYVPCNVVSEITDPTVLYSLQEKNNITNKHLIQQQQAVAAASGNLQSAQQVNYLNQQQQRPIQQQDQQQQQQPGGIKRMVALYDYDPQENSPNADTESEIPFKVGDVIYVYGKMDTDGFYMGEVERTKQTGLVPSNFLREEPLPVNAKLPTNLLMQQQQKQPFMKQMIGNQQQPQIPMSIQDPFQQQQQQQRQPNQNQQQPFINSGAVVGVQQQPGVGAANLPMAADPSLTNTNLYGASSQQQMQQMNKMNNINQPQQQQQQIQQPLQQQQQRGNIRGILPAPNQQLPQQQNINRPNSLSLGLNNNINPNQHQVGLNDWNSNNSRQQLMNNPMQQQPVNMQLQQQPNQNPMNMGMNPLQNQQQQPLQYGQNNPNMSLGSQVGQQQQQNPMNNPASGNMMMNQQHMMNNQQQQQQQGGGVLSNLLSSGKQIIGAATTPRAPNQPSQFTSSLANLGLGGGGMDSALNHSANIGGVGNFGGNRSNLIQNTFNNNSNSNDPSTSIHNSFGMTGGGLNQQQHHNINQQQQPYNSMMGGLNRGGLGGPMGGLMGNQQHHAGIGGGGGGEEQGGNILNTVKNMFKL